MAKPEIAEINTQPTDILPAMNKMIEFLTSFSKEGSNLRLEHLKVINGQRLTIIFDYDDMG